MPSPTHELQVYAQEKRLSNQTVQRWHAWTEADQAALLTMVQELQLGENHLRDILDWLDDIRARDGGTVYTLLMRTELQLPLQAKLSRNDKVKAVKAAFRKLRYPYLSQLEEDLRLALKALDLGERVRILFPPNLEGDDVTVEIKVRTIDELQRTLAQLQQRVENGSLRRIFDLLDEV
jgi:hypothetical protein